MILSLLAVQSFHRFCTNWTENAGKPGGAGAQRLPVSLSAFRNGSQIVVTGAARIRRLGLVGETIACAGFGNVLWGICERGAQLGAKVVTLSGPDRYIYDSEGITTDEKIDYLVEMCASGRSYGPEDPGSEFIRAYQKRHTEVCLF